MYSKTSARSGFVSEELVNENIRELRVPLFLMSTAAIAVM